MLTRSPSPGPSAEIIREGQKKKQSAHLPHCRSYKGRYIPTIKTGPDAYLLISQRNSLPRGSCLSILFILSILFSLLLYLSVSYFCSFQFYCDFLSPSFELLIPVLKLYIVEIFFSSRHVRLNLYIKSFEHGKS